MPLNEDKKNNELPIETPGAGASKEEREEFIQNVLRETFEKQQEKIEKELKKGKQPDVNIPDTTKVTSQSEKTKESLPKIDKKLSKRDKELFKETLGMLKRHEISWEDATKVIDHIRGITHVVITEKVSKPEIVEPPKVSIPAPAPTPAPAPEPSFHEELIQEQKNNEEREEFYKNIPSFNEKIAPVIDKWNDLFDVQRDAFAVSLKVITPEDLDTAVSLDANTLKQHQNLKDLLFIKQKAITDFLVSKYEKIPKQKFEEAMKPFVEELTELAKKVDELRSLLGKEEKRMTIEDVRRAKQLLSELSITVPARTRTTKEGRERKEKFSEQQVFQTKQLKVHQEFIDKIKESKEEYKKKPKGMFGIIGRWARDATDWALQFDFEREADKDIGKLYAMMDNIKDPSKHTNRLGKEYMKEKKRELAIDYSLMKNVDVDALWNAIPEATKPSVKSKVKETTTKEPETKEKKASLGEQLAIKLKGAQSLEDVNQILRENAIPKEAINALTELLQSYKENKEQKPGIKKMKEDISNIFIKNGVKLEDIDSLINVIVTRYMEELGIAKKEPVKKERFWKRFLKGKENLEKIGEVKDEKGKLKEVKKGLEKTGEKITETEETITEKEEKLKKAVTSEKTEKSKEPQKEPVVPPISPETPVIPPLPTETINKPEENKVITEEVDVTLNKISQDLKDAKKNKSFKEYFSNNGGYLKSTLGNIERKITNEADKKYIKILRNALLGISRSNTEEDLIPLANYLEEVLIDIIDYDDNPGSWRKATQEAQKKLTEFLQGKASKKTTPKVSENLEIKTKPQQTEQKKSGGEIIKFKMLGANNIGIEGENSPAGENILALNKASGEVVPIEEGFKYALSDYNFYYGQIFNVRGFQKGIKFSDLIITPAVVDKNGKLIKKGEITVKTDINTEEIEKTEEPPLVTQTQSTENLVTLTDIEAKKANIERKRQEELKEYSIDNMIKYFNENYKDTLGDIVLKDEKGLRELFSALGGTMKEKAKEYFDEFTYKTSSTNINEKYGEELADLTLKELRLKFKTTIDWKDLAKNVEFIVRENINSQEKLDEYILTLMRVIRRSTNDKVLLDKYQKALDDLLSYVKK